MLENKIFFVVPISSEIDECYEIFSSYPRAEAYIMRFNRNEGLKIVERGIDQDFITDRERSCYFLEFRGVKSEHPWECAIVTNTKTSLEALEMKTHVERNADGEIEVFSVTLLAASKDEAVRLAREARDAQEN